MNLPDKWITFDPGESTGYAVFEKDRLVQAGTADLWECIHSLSVAIGVGESFFTRLAQVDPYLIQAFAHAEEVVVEDWAIYPWKAKELSWDKCRTARGIGAIQLICDLGAVRYIEQPAKIKEASEAAGAADLFLRPLDENRHANDAIRHGFYRALKAGEGIVPG